MHEPPAPVWALETCCKARAIASICVFREAIFALTGSNRPNGQWASLGERLQEYSTNQVRRDDGT